MRNSFTVWIRPGLLLLVGLTLMGCAQGPVVQGSFPDRGQSRTLSERAHPQRQQLVAFAQQMLGTPYRYGGASPGRGFDCSGLVYFGHRRLGIEVPRTSADQRRHSRTVSLESLRPGDLLFFDLAGAKGSHVGIYIGRGRFIHAPSSGKTVSRSSLDNPYWSRHLAGAGSFL